MRIYEVFMGGVDVEIVQELKRTANLLKKMIDMLESVIYKDEETGNLYVYVKTEKLKQQE